MTKPVRLEMRVRNNVLWHAIFDHYSSVAEFARLRNVDHCLVGGLLNLTMSPFRKRDGGYYKFAIDVANAAGVPLEILYPENLYGGISMPKVAVEMNLPELPIGREALYLPAPDDATDLTTNNEFREALSRAMDGLSEREQSIIRARYGLDTGAEMTLREMGSAQGVGHERIRQIEARALRKLRHPSRSRHLRAFLEDMQ